MRLGLPSVKGVVSTLQRGAVDAVKVIGGKAAARFLGNLAPANFKDTLVKNLAVQTAAGLVVGLAAARFFSADTARFVLAGGLSAPIEAALKPVPLVGPLLGDDYLSLGDSDDGLSAYLPGFGEGYEADDTRSEGSPAGMGLYTGGGDG